ADRTLPDHQHGFSRLQSQRLNSLQTSVHWLDKCGLLERDPLRNLHQPSLNDPIHHTHALGKSTSRRPEPPRTTHLLICRTLREDLPFAVEALPTRNMVEDHDTIAHCKSLDFRTGCSDHA